MKNRYLIGDFSGSEVVQKAKALVPVLRERAERQWEQPRIFQETIDDLFAAGIMQVFQPKRWGGGECHPSEIFETVMTLAEGDASVAWVAGVVGVHSFHLAQFDERAQADVWESDPKALVGSPYAPAGTAVRVPGGYRLSGRWRFSSGCHHCSWTFLGANLPDVDGGDPSFASKAWATLLLPRKDYEIVENWNVYGMRATGSHDIVVKDAFVPDHRVLLFADLEDGKSPGLKVNKGDLYKIPFWQMFGRATSSVVPVGALKGMVDGFIHFARDRRAGTGNKVAEDPAVALAIAEAIVTIDDVKATVHRSLATLYDWIEQGNLAHWETRRQFRFQASYGPKRCADAASELYRVFGGSAIYADFPFGRQLNDILAVRSHFTNHYQLHANTWIGHVMGLEVKGIPV